MVLRDDKSDDGYHWECPVNPVQKTKVDQSWIFFLLIFDDSSGENRCKTREEDFHSGVPYSVVGFNFVHLIYC